MGLKTNTLEARQGTAKCSLCLPLRAATYMDLPCTGFFEANAGKRGQPLFNRVLVLYDMVTATFSKRFHGRKLPFADSRKAR